MGCCCSLPTPATSEAADALLAGYDAGAQFSVARVDSDEHALWAGAVDALAQAFCGTASKASFPPFGWIYSGETETGPLPAAPTPTVTTRTGRPAMPSTNTTSTGATGMRTASTR